MCSKIIELNLINRFFGIGSLCYGVVIVVRFYWGGGIVERNNVLRGFGSVS